MNHAAVAEVNNYYTTQWTNSVANADDALDWLFTSCSTSSACALHEPTPAAVRVRYERIVDSLLRHPVAVVDGAVYGMVDWDMARGVIFESLYAPYNSFPNLAHALADLETGDGRAMYALSGRDDSTWRCDSPSTSDVQPEINTAILCGDGDPVLDDHEQLERWQAELRKSGSWADMMSVRPACAGWKMQTKNPFRGA